jgi:hypothetical protein
MIQGKFMAEIMRMFVVVMGIFCDIMMEWKRLRIFGRSLADSPRKSLVVFYIWGTS